jgi:hypothetical protein
MTDPGPSSGVLGTEEPVEVSDAGGLVEPSKAHRALNMLRERFDDEGHAIEWDAVYDEVERLLNATDELREALRALYETSGLTLVVQSHDLLPFVAAREAAGKVLAAQSDDSAGMAQ